MHHKPLSPNFLIDDPDVRIAAEALEELGAGKEAETRGESVFLGRVASYHPIISSAVNAYEASKSKVPGLRSVTSRFDVDAFACRQLDRIETSPKWIASFGAALSEESIRGLRFCIQWLRVTNSSVECMINQMLALLSRSMDTDTDTDDDALVSQTELDRKLAVFKANITETIKRTVEIVAKYAASALPGPARVRVREYILGIPGRWQRKADKSQTEASKTMCLARECLEVLSGVCSVLEDTLSGAEEWCGRFGKPVKRE